MPLSRRAHERLQEALSWTTAIVASASLYFIFSARGAGAAAGAAAGPTLPPARARALTADTPVLFDAPADGPGGAAAGAGALR
jgi:hypothetical protein